MQQFFYKVAKPLILEKTGQSFAKGRPQRPVVNKKLCEPEKKGLKNKISVKLQIKFLKQSNAA